MTMYWCSTTIMKADEPSRVIDFDEEYIPKFLYDHFCDRFNIYPTVDCMATFANTKCSKFFSWKPCRNNHDNGQDYLGCNFFAQKVSSLQDEILFLFPPKRLTNKVAGHLGKYFMKNNFLLIFHAIGELPMAVSQLIYKGAQIFALDEEKISIIPAEKRMEANGQTFIGFWNTRQKTSYAIVNYVGHNY